MSVVPKSSDVELGALSQQRVELLRLLLRGKFPTTSAAVPRLARKPGATLRAPTSWQQQRLWFIDQLEGGSAGYLVPLAVRLRGQLDREALQAALDTVVQRHEGLRTVFITASDGAPVQEVAPEARFALQIVDLSAHEQAERELQVRRHEAAETHEKFDLRAGPLIRGRLLRLQPTEHVLIVIMHHVVADGWSKGIFLHEFSELYRANLHGAEEPLEALPLQYADYSQWQAQWLQTDALNDQLSYWQSSLQGIAPELALPTDRRRPSVQSFRGENLPLCIDATLAEKVRAFARRSDLTLFMVLYAAWTILLARLSGQDDVAVGTPIANRQRSEFERLIGLFVNTLVLRVAVSADQPIAEFLAQVRQVTLAAYDHQDVPFDRVVRALKPERSLSRNPLFQAAFVLQNVPKAELQLPGLTATIEDILDEPAILDLTLLLEERGAEIGGIINYASELFERSTIERWVRCFAVVLEAIASESYRCVGELPVLPPDERRAVVELFNATASAYPRERLVHQLFEDVVERAPEATAVICDRQPLTYAGLNRKANQLAHYLIGAGLKVGEYVPVLMSRSIEIVVAQLAVLKSGGVYVPVDPDLPAERQAFVIRDCGAHRVLASQSGPAPNSGAVQWIDYGQLAAKLDSCPTENPRVDLSQPPPAYVMYTSGSTGIPKGVVVPHRAVNRLVINSDYAQIEPRDCVAHCSNTTFDASTFEIWAPLLNGAVMLIVPQAVVLDSTRLRDMLEERRVTVLFLTVGLFAQYAEVLATAFSRLRYLITGGDVVEPEVARRVLRDGRPMNLLNAYGPTECTTFSTTYRIEALDASATSIPIGRPIANAQIYVLDSRMQPVPIGVTGQIYVGGAGVALGYLNRPELTRERFVPDPFDAGSGATLYRTGDLGRWRADGNVEFLGRNDHQIKLRGFRVELGEIEAHLARHPHVREAAVIVRADVPGEKRLVAYLTGRTANAPSADTLRTDLKAVLPEYMIPSAFVVLDHLPLTPSGKVDRKSLPTPDISAYVTQKYEAPRGPVEAALAGIWRELLQVERVGRHDNFFDFGGHSLLATRVISRIRELLLVELSLRALFDAPSVAMLAACIDVERAMQADREANRTESLARDLRDEVDSLPNDEVLARIAQLEDELGAGPGDTCRGAALRQQL